MKIESVLRRLEERRPLTWSCLSSFPSKRCPPLCPSSCPSRLGNAPFGRTNGSSVIIHNHISDLSRVGGFDEDHHRPTPPLPLSCGQHDPSGLTTGMKGVNHTNNTPARNFPPASGHECFPHFSTFLTPRQFTLTLSTS